MDTELKGQIAIITGASSGIGTGIAKSMAEAGATVVINHSSEKSKEAAEAIVRQKPERRELAARNSRRQKCFEAAPSFGKGLHDSL